MQEFIIKPQRKFTIGWRELWQYRELFYFFTWRDVKVRYKQATLGVLWAAMQPLSMMLVFTLIFGRGLQVASDGLPYPVFAFSGLMIWQIFSSGLMNAANSMVANSNIIKKIYFPRLIIPMSSILTALFDFSFAFVAFIGLILYFQQPVHVLRFIIFVTLSILMTVMTTFGLGTLIAAWNVKYRDFQYVIPFFIQFLLFVNPVVYSSKVFENHYFTQKIMAFNPIAGAINLVRNVFISTENGGQNAIEWTTIGGQFLVAFALLTLGIYTFRSMESYFADLA